LREEREEKEKRTCNRKHDLLTRDEEMKMKMMK
jgi:hypothetical protein